MDQYINNLDYRRDVNSRLAFIFDSVNGYNPSKKIYIVWSYADKLRNKAEGLDKAGKLFKERNIGNPTSVVLVNMTDREEVKKIVNKIFGF